MSLGLRIVETSLQAETLYSRLRPGIIPVIIRDFYSVVFEDPLLAHFFFKIDRESLILNQIAFTEALLGGPSRYKGRPLQAAHKDLLLRQPHLARRQRIMSDILAKHGIDLDLSLDWLKKESQILKLITRDTLDETLFLGCMR